jgi:hypothetical protein
MEKNISISSTSLLESISMDMLIPITSFMDEKSQLELALACKQLLAVFRACFKKSNYFLLCSSEFHTEYSNCIKRLFENYLRRKAGWNRIEITTTVHDLNNFEYSSVNGNTRKHPSNCPIRL